jgi:hypothetical protein
MFKTSPAPIKIFVCGTPAQRQIACDTTGSKLPPVEDPLAQPMHVLASQHGRPPGFAAMEITIPPHFAGAIPHAHDAFDEAIYVLSRHLLVVGDDEPYTQRRARCSQHPAGSRTASATVPLSTPWCPGPGRRLNPHSRSCVTSAPP